MINQDWSIQSRSDRCAATGEPFADGQPFYTLLFEEKAAFRREDLSVQAFQAREADAPKPAYFWRAKFETPPPKPPEPLGKQTAEDLLRAYMAEQTPQHANARYILALMLERKRVLKEVETRETDGQLVRIYEHTKTGEVFLIPDPRLHLDQVATVQMEIADLLGAPSPGTAPPSQPTADLSTTPQAPTEAASEADPGPANEPSAHSTPESEVSPEEPAPSDEPSQTPAIP